MHDKIVGFRLQMKNREQGFLYFTHPFSNNNIKVAATEEEMKRFHVDHVYDLELRPDMFHVKKEEKAA